MISIIDNLLKHQNIAYAIFNPELALIEKSKNLSKVISASNLSINSSIYDIFPEFFGSEDLIEEIIKGTGENLGIQKVNKVDSKGNLFYVDYKLLPTFEENKPLLLLVSNSTEKSTLEQNIQQKNNEIKILKESLANLNREAINNILGTSEAMKVVKNFIKKVANINETTIMLTGASGTGKTLVARGIHNSSENSNAPFVEINCATIPPSLLESEIFGHIKGSFTSAVDNKKGLLEEANGGTLFLDEIGELPISVQPKFLSFLESKRFRPVGGTKEISVNVRIIAATNKDLKEAISQKDFREDLYYRINVLSLEIPSLRERNDDIVIIAEYFVKQFSNNFKKISPSFSDSAKTKLKNYSWPGNIRELRNIIERAVIFCESEIIDYDDLLITEDDFKNHQNVIIPEEGIDMLELEKKYINAALNSAKGNQTKAAKLLGLTLDTFRYRIKKHNEN